MDCVPKSRKDPVVCHDRGTSHDLMSHNFRVWGRTGTNADGYAWEERPDSDSSGGGATDGVAPMGGCEDKTPIKDTIKMCVWCVIITKNCRCLGSQS